VTSFSSGGSAQTEGYCCDALNRLTAVYSTASPTCGAGSPTQSYSFDRVGNRTALTTSAGTTTYSYDSANQLTSVTPPGGTAQNHSYDANGSETGRFHDTFSWDTANRLQTVTIANVVTQTMTYNGDGLRQTRSTTSPCSPCSTTMFVWDVQAKLPVVIDDGTAYIYSAAGLAEQVTNTSPYNFYFLTNGLASTMAVVDASSTVQQTESYDVYGQATPGANNHPAEYQFAGQQTDTSGLQYARARYYDSSTGRFLTRDPDPGCIFDPAQRNAYVYAKANPANLTDPSGLAGTGGGSAGDCANLAVKISRKAFGGPSAKSLQQRVDEILRDPYNLWNRGCVYDKEWCYEWSTMRGIWISVGSVQSHIRAATEQLGGLDGDIKSWENNRCDSNSDVSDQDKDSVNRA
jgi:RHS repeat-associated protein